MLPLGIHRSLGLEDGLAADGGALGPRQERSGSNKVKPRPPPGWHQLREKPEKDGTSRGPGCPWGWKGPLTCAPHSHVVPTRVQGLLSPLCAQNPSVPTGGAGSASVGPASGLLAPKEVTAEEAAEFPASAWCQPCPCTLSAPRLLPAIAGHTKGSRLSLLSHLL